MGKITAAITAVQGYVPEHILSNEDLAKLVDTSDEWITTRTGIKERRIMKDGASSDMAAAAAIFKYKILSSFDNISNILTVAPSTIKKHAGKGNMNKRVLWDVFTENRLNDEDLGKSEFHEYVKGLEIGKSVPKPLDDLVDAYFLAKYISTLETL
jgi:hypothetical protein